MNFQEWLGRLAELTNEQLAELHVGLVEMFEEKRTEELSISGVSELADLSDAIDKVSAEMHVRSESRAALETKVAGLVSAVESTKPAVVEAAEGDDDAPAEGDDAPAEGDATEETAAEGAISLSPSDVESRDVTELAVYRGNASITAGADIPGMSAGTELPDVSAIAKAFVQRRTSFRGVSRDGDGDRVIVASIRGDYPEERRLGADLGENMDKIESVISPEAITASGGLCAPLEPYYGIKVISQASRPVRDALANFGADRGGVRFLPPPVLTDLNASIGITTAAQDAVTYGTGNGQTPFKPCLHVTCGTEQTVTIDAIHRCLTFGNFAARTYPEQVEAWIALSLAAHARRAETKMLDAISAECTQVTAAATYSAVRSLLPQIDTALAGYRSRHRASDNIRMHVMLPSWAKELLRADMARGWQGNDMDPLFISDEQITGWFTMRNVSVSWYIDTETGKGQQFGAQSAGALLGFPSTVRWYLYVEGDFVFLDGGTLDLGLVRDSTLNSTNDYQIFAETWEAVAFFGIEALAITSTVHTDGSHAPAASALAPTSG